MNQFELTAELRNDVGKGASRRLRRSGKVPGVVYGGGNDAVAVTFNHDELLHQLDQEAFYSHILTLKLDKNKEKVVLKDLQRHPFKLQLLHIDLQRISEKEKLTMRVPIHFINEEKCIGVKQSGGVISHVITELEISCLPKDLPEYIEVDLENVDVGDTIHLGDLVFPEGVESYTLQHGGDPSASVVSVNIPREIEEVEEELEEEIEAAAVPTTKEEAEAESEAETDTGSESSD
jgi:large subunit ribosomal protein L25